MASSTFASGSPLRAAVTFIAFMVPVTIARPSSERASTASAIAVPYATLPSASPGGFVTGERPVRGFFGGTDKPAPWAPGDIDMPLLLLCVALQAEEDG